MEKKQLNLVSEWRRRDRDRTEKLFFLDYHTEVWTLSRRFACVACLRVSSESEKQANLPVAPAVWLQPAAVGGHCETDSLLARLTPPHSQAPPPLVSRHFSESCQRQI